MALAPTPTNQYNENAVRQTLSNAVIALWWANGKVELSNIRKFLDTSPRTLQRVTDPVFLMSYCAQMLALAEINRPAKEKEVPLAQKFFLEILTTLNGSVRSSIEFELSLLLDPMFREPLHSMFCAGTTVSPDDIVLRNKIVVVALADKEPAELGTIANRTWKFATQRAMERNLSRPVQSFIWTSSPEFCPTEYDKHFELTSRSSQCSVIAG